MLRWSRPTSSGHPFLELCQKLTHSPSLSSLGHANGLAATRFENGRCQAAQVESGGFPCLITCAPGWTEETAGARWSILRQPTAGVVGAAQLLAAVAALLVLESLL
eukprot:1910451-Pyramimonas_sp.AAC.1